MEQTEHFYVMLDGIVTLATFNTFQVAFNYAYDMMNSLGIEPECLSINRRPLTIYL